ncbi:MAG: hypothetical protein AAF317_19695 [Pseudomonadota bacterium]
MTKHDMMIDRKLKIPHRGREGDALGQIPPVQQLQAKHGRAADCGEFIRKVYGPWVMHGLLQSDLKHLDPKLYNHMHKQLSLMSESEREATHKRLQIPKERSDEALKLIADPFKRAVTAEVRRIGREKQQRYRARQRGLEQD